ncbi:MAG TPA: neutral zinc metallopeptidase [Thermoanaerobaculia bacterium]|nr:neutral zinc metallopeptidase [Thermoanaerobaculia bacterium]
MMTTSVRKLLALPLLLAAAFFLPTPTPLAQTTRPAQAQAVHAEMAPDRVAELIYAEIQQIHGYRSTPRLHFGVRAGRTRSSCGRIDGSGYCPVDHAVFITSRDIAMAYQHGDAALAFIIAHEYAHAMQTAFRFMPRITPMAELQADCLAGVYLGSLPNVTYDRSDMREIGTLAYRIGDYRWGRLHHGTPDQRVQAVLHGIGASRDGLEGARACMAS